MLGNSDTEMYFFVGGTSLVIPVVCCKGNESSGIRRSLGATVPRTISLKQIIFPCPLALILPFQTKSMVYYFYVRSYFLMSRHINVMSLTIGHFIYESLVKC